MWLRAKKLTMSSPFVVGFYVLGVGLVLNIFIFFVENILPVMKNGGILDN